MDCEFRAPCFVELMTNEKTQIDCVICVEPTKLRVKENQGETILDLSYASIVDLPTRMEDAGGPSFSLEATLNLDNENVTMYLTFCTEKDLKGFTSCMTAAYNRAHQRIKCDPNEVKNGLQRSQDLVHLGMNKSVVTNYYTTDYEPKMHDTTFKESCQLVVCNQQSDMVGVYLPDSGQTAVVSIGAKDLKQSNVRKLGDGRWFNALPTDHQHSRMMVLGTDKAILFDPLSPGSANPLWLADGIVHAGNAIAPDGACNGTIAYAAIVNNGILVYEGTVRPRVHAFSIIKYRFSKTDTVAGVRLVPNSWSSCRRYIIFEVDSRLYIADLKGSTDMDATPVQCLRLLTKESSPNSATVINTSVSKELEVMAVVNSTEKSVGGDAVISVVRRWRVRKDGFVPIKDLIREAAANKITHPDSELFETGNSHRAITILSNTSDPDMPHIVRRVNEKCVSIHRLFRDG